MRAPDHRELRFSVFGRLLALVDGPRGWTPFVLGADGKRRPAEFVVPAFLGEDDLAEYLADLFHEMATPSNGDVRRLD